MKNILSWVFYIVAAIAVHALMWWQYSFYFENPLFPIIATDVVVAAVVAVVGFAAYLLGRIDIPPMFLAPDGYAFPANDNEMFAALDRIHQAARAPGDGSDPQRDLDNQFASMFEQFAASVHATARDKGWWDRERNDGELIALIHSELSDGLEGLRHGNPPDDKVPEFSAIEAEYADVIIRIMDHAHARGWRVGAAVVAKSRMNRTRERMHGGKQF